MSELTLPWGDKPQGAHPPVDHGDTGLISLSSALGQALGTIERAYRQRQCELKTNADAWAEAEQMSQVERLQKSSQFLAASANLGAKAATLPDDAARPLLARARSFQDRARLIAEGWA